MVRLALLVQLVRQELLVPMVPMVLMVLPLR
jgi:hypothetical protein